MTTKKNLEKLSYYKNLYIKYKKKYIKKHSLQKGGLLEAEQNKSYQTKLNEFRNNITHILDKKHNEIFSNYCIQELKNSTLTGGEIQDFEKICNNNSDKNFDKNKIYGGLLTFIDKYNFTNLKEFAKIYVKKKKSERYKELIQEFDRNNYHKGGFLKYHKLDSLPQDINLFQSSLENHYKQPLSLEYGIKKKIKEYYKHPKSLEHYVKKKIKKYYTDPKSLKHDIEIKFKEFFYK